MTWDQFITTRQSPKFKTESEKHRKAFKKCSYPYRGSRLGYARLEEEMEEVSQQAAKGEIKLSGQEDLLATVLQRKEHPGRFLAVGSGGWTQCELASPDPGNPIVAIEKVFNAPEMQGIGIYNVPLELGHIKISIIDTKILEAPISVPTNEACVLFEAKGSYVQWPKNLIFLEKVKISIKI
ncbi:hypothetical protein V2J09_016648 [Rumex salicifolius]